jgi:uncharacterized RDD family membrane protein YckC
MSLVCPRCSRTLSFSGERPSFCAYCGQRLSDPRYEDTVTHPTTPANRAWRDSDGGRTIPLGGERPAAPPPERVAGYKLIRALGSGGMGTVYEALDETLGRRVALKLIAPEYVSSREAVERFRQEGRMASALEHPRCVFVLAADEEEGRPYIVMELMPGATLQSLVAERGPLPVEEAVSKILDVVEGLQEAHHLGIIHRDIKPSNCFLDAEGRVKVGDFGLSKSLSVDANLTRTGSFVGTPLYASPEQIKGDPVDERTDVYSLAATLYYVLAGRPPFQESDAAATLARIVSEEPAPLRKVRRDINPALEAVLLRGLDRDRERRYRTLAEFREALVPFAPQSYPAGRPGLRTAAFLLDLIVIMPLAVLLNEYIRGTWAEIPADLVLWLAYLVPLEAYWGATLGKRLARLRVCGLTGYTPPGLGRAFVRALVFYTIVLLPTEVASIVDDRLASTFRPIVTLAMLAGTLVVLGLSLLALAATMRARTGFRGPHEWVSGTRVVHVPHRARRRVPRTRRPIRPAPAQFVKPPGVLETLGPYRIHGALRWEPDRRVLLGEDSTLGRPIWIELRPKGHEPPSPMRRELTRATRPRWISGGEQSGGRWDAYVAPSGCSLADLAGPRGLPWGELRPILEDLAAELVAACQDGTLPPRLSVDQVWIQPGGGAMLVDALAPGGPAAEADLEPRQRALELLRQAAILGLEGGRRRPDAGAPVVRAPVPRHVSAILGRLLGRERPYASPDEFAADLHAERDRPTEVGAGRRLAHLGVQSLLHLPGLLLMFITSYYAITTGEAVRDRVWAVPVVIFPVLWVAWSALTRGGMSLKLMEMTLARLDGRPASRLQCAWRSLLIWAPPTGLLLAALDAAARQRPEALVSWWLALALLPLSIAIALAFPDRGPHDRLSGTYVVPL